MTFLTVQTKLSPKTLKINRNTRVKITLLRILWILHQITSPTSFFYCTYFKKGHDIIIIIIITAVAVVVNKTINSGEKTLNKMAMLFLKTDLYKKLPSSPSQLGAGALNKAAISVRLHCSNCRLLIKNSAFDVG